MDADGYAITGSLFLLTALLAFLSSRSAYRYLSDHEPRELPWIGGLALAAAAMAIESAVFLGATGPILLQGYVFASAAIVGVLSLGAVHVLRRPRAERGYYVFTLAMIALVAAVSFSTPPASGMVANGVIAGDPSLLLVVLSSFVTFPATVVLLVASAIALRRSRKWQTILLIAGALILGAGGTLYIASFPATLYYTEFAGIILLFFGLVSLPHPSPAPTTFPTGAPTG